MKKLYMGQKMIVSALAGMILIPGSVVRIQAAETEEQQCCTDCRDRIGTGRVLQDKSKRKSSALSCANRRG